MSETNGEVQWPPRSPHEAQLGTPGGRRRLAQRTSSPSPSPIKRSRSTPSRLDQAAQNMDLIESDDEDEETLQLQLQAIQARLKLKKLQKAKAKDGGSSDIENERSRPTSTAPLSRSNSTATNYEGKNLAALREQRQKERSKENTGGINVPASPVKRAVLEAAAPVSPGRVRLGIDKGLKGSDISLARAPALKKKANGENDGRSYLQRAKSEMSTQRAGETGRREPLAEAKVLSFSERMANSRAEESKRRDLQARIQNTRTDAFGISEQEMAKYKSTATTIPGGNSSMPTEFSRDQVVGNYNKAPGGLLQRSKTVPSLKSGARITSTSTTSSQVSAASTGSQPKPRGKGKKADAPPTDTVEFDPFSCLHLSKRIIPHNVLTRTLAGKKTFLLPEFLKSVTAPDFSLPEIPEDIVLLAIVASKSDPKEHKAKPGQENEARRKFMVLTLCDLKWELDLFLFGSGFDKFWKLTVGTVIAILNPGVMPPVRANTNKFSLTISNSNDTILEIGTARDLGFCASVKKDGKSCDAWIDKRHTEFCEFHTNEVIRKTKSNRMEVNTMDFGYGARKVRSQNMTGFMDRHETRQEEKKGISYNRETQSTVYVSKLGRPPTTASLIDQLDVADSYDRGMSKSDLLAKRRAEAERERGIARKLAEIGGGMGADYMRLQDQSQSLPSQSSSAPDGPPAPPDAAQLGLLGGKAKDVHLSPVKRKRAGTAASNADPMGWGGNLSKELARMKDGERLQPIKKKTRFITPNGIREAGRESFGGEASKGVTATTSVHDNDDDDDDLDIV